MTDQLGHIIDVVPTCLELAGGKPLTEIDGRPTQPLEGKSLLPIFRGGSRPPAEQICWEWSGNLAIRRGRWKLVRDTLNKLQKWELYDLEADRTELHDVAAQQPERVAELSTAYSTWAKSLGRRLPGEKGKKADD
jgi:arylsulfatase